MATNGLLSGGGPLFGGTASDIGILGYTPTTSPTTVARGGANVPLEQAMFEGSNKYENYARAYPDLMQHYLSSIPTDKRSLGDWGKAHWETFGQPEGRLGPDAFPASRHLPGMAEAYDPRAGVTDTIPLSGLPMPDVEGYKYAYRPYEWSPENSAYEELSYDEYDITKYPYYPYLPSGGMASDAERILAGVKLVPDTGQTGITSKTYGEVSDTTTDTTTIDTTTDTTAESGWAGYVTRHPDLATAYDQYLAEQNSGIVDFWEEPGIRHSVGGMSAGYPGTAMSKEQFGHAHWLEFGQYEPTRVR